MTVHLTVRRLAVVLAIALVLIVVLLRQETQTNRAVSATASPISGLCSGDKQGVIKGSTTTKGREGTYSITAMTHGLTTPRDPASGQATGRRQHKPLTFTMIVDKSTPQLITALVNNERLTSCVFNFWRPTTTGPGAGVEKNYYRIQLGNARVVEHNFAGRPGGSDVVNFSLTYQKITWTWMDGGITASDDWESPATR